MSRYRLIPILFFVLVTAGHTAPWDGLLADTRAEEAVRLFRDGEYQTTARFLSSLVETPPASAAAEGLGVMLMAAAVAAERGSDGAAYSYWGRAQALFAEAGTDWTRVRNRTEERIRMLAQTAGTSGARWGPGTTGGLPPSRLEIFWSLFGLGRYDRPAGGLERMETGNVWRQEADAAQPVIPYTEGGISVGSTKPMTAGVGGRLGRRPAVAGNAPGMPILPMDRDSGEGEARSESLPMRPAGPRVDVKDREAARAAWQYFAANQQPLTGLVNGIQGYPVVTVWEMGSILAALTAAEALGILPAAAFDQWMVRLLRTFEGMDLFEKNLPNKLYFSDSARMVGEDQQPSDTGIGCSAIDTARLVIWLTIVSRRHPRHSDAVDRILERVAAKRLVSEGRLTGYRRKGGRVEPVPEGHFGYGPYAARGLSLVGENAWVARDIRPHLRERMLFGVRFFHDERSEAVLASNPFLVTLMEFGREDGEEDRMVRDLYAVQEARYRNTGILTAAGAGRLDRSPWFGTSAITAWGGRQDWVFVSPFTRDPLPLFWADTGVAFAWDALYNTGYTRTLVGALGGLRSQGQGFYAGRYDSGEENRSVNLDTNALILEAVFFRLVGRGILVTGVRKEAS